MFWSVLWLLPLCIAHALPSLHKRSPPSDLLIRPLCQFPNLTWIENIAVRSNGQLLVTLFSSPDLYQIDPSQQHPVPQLVAQFPQALGILGITEIEEDVFAITKGNFSSVTGDVVPKSFSVWKADFRGCKTPALSKIVDVPDASILNGATVVRKGSNFILIADSIGGVIWRVNLQTSAYDVALNNSATQPTTPFIEGGFGANGVHTEGGFLYFTNTNLGFYRVPIHDDGTPAGPVQLLESFIRGDDFTFDKQGNVYIARGAVDLIDKITPTGQQSSLAFQNADAELLIEGNTAVKFGRTPRDKRTLYVTTNGGMSGLVNGTSIQGGRVLAIDL